MLRLCLQKALPAICLEMGKGLGVLEILTLEAGLDVTEYFSQPLRQADEFQHKDVGLIGCLRAVFQRRINHTVSYT